MKQKVRIQLLEGDKKFNTDGYYDDQTGRLESPFPGQINKVWNEAGQLLLIKPAPLTNTPPQPPPKVQNGK